MRIPDNYDLFCIHQDEQERELKKLPKCNYCGQTITDDYVYEIDNEIVCEECMKDNYRKPIEDFMEE